MTTWTTRIASTVAFVAACTTVHAQTAAPASRGQLLYDTHCLACHDTQVHWRDGKRVRNWDTLVAQVRRWQAVADLRWSDDDILQVARHLNARIYRYPAGALAQRE